MAPWLNSVSPLVVILIIIYVIEHFPASSIGYKVIISYIDHHGHCIFSFLIFIHCLEVHGNIFSLYVRTLILLIIRKIPVVDRIYQQRCIGMYFEHFSLCFIIIYLIFILALVIYVKFIVSIRPWVRYLRPWFTPFNTSLVLYSLTTTLTLLW